MMKMITTKNRLKSSSHLFWSTTTTLMMIVVLIVGKCTITDAFIGGRYVQQILPQQQQRRRGRSPTITTKEEETTTTIATSDALSLVVLGATFSSSAPSNKQFGGDDGKGSYSDNMLRLLHFNRQEEYIIGTNALATYNEEQKREQQEIKEWQDSFDRNGLSDFVPPISEGMQCLMVGDGIHTPPGTNEQQQHDDHPVLKGGPHYLPPPDKLPWESVAQAEITSLRVLEASLPNNDEEEQQTTTQVLSDDEKNDGDSYIDISRNINHAVRTELVPTTTTGSSSSSSIKEKNDSAIYDCIVDKGLMDAVIALEDKAAVRELVFEASNAIRELGIYVIVTRHLDMELKNYLVNCSKDVGMEWLFDLDGITNSETTVSVARRYFAGEMPPVGKLSRRYRP